MAIQDMIADWGCVGDGVTDDRDPGYLAGRAYFIATSQPPFVQVLMPPGTYVSTSGYANFLSDGSTPDLLRAYIAARSATMVQAAIGGHGQIQNASNNAAVESVSQGDASATLVDSGDATIFSVGDWCILTDHDYQGFGYPLNPHNFEYLKISDITAGVITFTTPVRHRYRSTLPNFEPGDAFEIDLGGPANLYKLIAFDVDLNWNGLTTDYAGTGQVYGPGRSQHFVDCDFQGYGYLPTQQDQIVFRRGANGIGGSDGSQAIEMDKCVKKFRTFSHAVHRLHYQSSSIFYENHNSSSFAAGLQGTARRSIHRDSTIASSSEMRFGIEAYGHSDFLYATGGTWNNATIADQHMQVLMSAYTDMGSGVLRHPISDGPRVFDVIGTWVYPSVSNGTPMGPAFQVEDITHDGTYVYIQTSFSSFPTYSITPETDPTYWRVCPCQAITLRDMTTSDLDVTALKSAPAGRPLWEYNTRTYSDSWGAGETRSMRAYGTLVSVIIDVQTAYVGANSPVLRFSSAKGINAINLDPSPRTINQQDVQIDLSTTGTRTFTPGSTTGSTGADANMTALGNVWFWSGMSWQVTESTVSGSVQPVFTVTAQLDQGINPNQKAIIITGAAA